MSINENQISAIVDKVVSQIVPDIKTVKNKREQVKQAEKVKSDYQISNTLGCFTDIESAINAAEKAFHEYQIIPIEQRKKIIARIREVCLENVELLAKTAHDETGLGRRADKVKKNTLAIKKTPGVEDLEPRAFTGDDGLTVLELAPYGLIGSIAPCTNPSETIINNSISMLAGGNVVVFNPHPSAKKNSALTVSLINKAIISAGGPANLVATITTPTIESAQILMKHPKVKLLVVTGGPAVVNVAMKSGKKVIAAGPGNPPVVVDETADIDKAAKDIIASASMDNNVICLIEKNIIVTKKAADALNKALVKYGAVELGSYQAKKLEQLIVDGDHPSKKYVGKDIQVILRDIGMEVGADKRLAIADVAADHPFATIELLMPVLPFIRANDFDEALEIAYKLEGGRGHTAAIHSKNIEHLHRMAVKMNTSIFVKNGPALAGIGFYGEGPTSFTIASPTGEGVTTARHFTRIRRCVLSGYFRIT